MEFTRDIMNRLEIELNNYQKPLLIIGARQIGKTTTIRNFLNDNQTNYLYVNLDSDAAARAIFDQDFVIDRILLELQLMYNQGTFDTIFFDEILKCPRALTSLKYFQENSTVKVICSGSGLGVTINHFGHSFPVGKVKTIEMYPMSFPEFLAASGEQMLLGIMKSSDFNQALNNTAHNLLLEKFDMYMMVSGFPESVASYLQTGDITKSFEIINDIFEGYKNDINKYASNTDALKIRSIYDNINAMLVSDNQKFKFSVVDKQGYKSLNLAFEWLNNSFLTYPVYKLSPKFLTLPLSMYKKENEFKLLVNETSILMHNYDCQYLGLMRGNDNIFKGVIYENYVGTVLARYYKQLYYYHHKTTEVDYILNINNQLVAVEIKSGNNNPSKSLQYFIEKHELSHALKVTRSNIYKQDKVLNIPVYLLDIYCQTTNHNPIG